MSKTEILCINVNDATVKEYIKEFGELAVAKAMTKWNEMGYDDLPPKSIMGSLKELTIKESNGEEAIDSFRSLQTAVRKEKAIPLYNRLATDRAIDVSIENYGTAKAAIEKNIKLDDQAKEEATSRLAEQFVKENHKFMIGDGDSKMDQFKQKLRSLYEKMKTFINDSEVEKMLMLLSRDKNYLGEGKSFSSDFKASITKLYEEGVDEQNQQKIELAKRLFSKTNSELISLFSYSKSNRFIPYIKFFPGNSKQPVKISNLNLEIELGNIAFEHISQWKDSQVNGLISRQLDNAKNTFEDDALFLQKLTGIEVKHWENYAKSKTWDYTKITKNQLLKSFIMRDKVTGPIKTKEQLLDKLIKAQGINKGSAINTISINTPIEDKINPNNLSSRFKNAKFNTKSTARLSTQVSDRLESLGGNFDYSKSFYKDNAFVNQWKENTPIVAGIDGHSVKKGDEYVSEQADNLADEDLFNTIQMMFDKQTTIAREGNYMQNVGQFGDKGDLLFVEMKRYDDIKEVEKLYIERLKKQKFKWIEDGKSVYKTLTDAEAKLVVASIKADGQTHFKGTLDERHLMAMNYAYGFNLVNEFINGKNEQYGKPDKGKDGKIYFKTSPLVDMFKRNGSQNSPGMIGDEDVEGGLGKGFRHLVVNIPEMDGAHLMDGQRFVRRTHSDKVNKSYGSVFNFGTVIKAISTLTDEKGNRFMDKSGAIVIDEFVADLKSKGIDGTVYQNLLEFMEKHDIESVSTTDTTKFTGGKKALKMFEGDKFVEPTFTNIDDHVYFIPTSEYRVQQDLVNDGKFYESTVPIQRMKNMMHIADAPAIAEMYNRIGAQKIDKIINVLKTTSTKEWRAYILGELNFNESEINDITEENEREEGFGDITEIEKLLAGGVEFEHVWVQNWLHTFMANTITKQALGRVTNKALAVEMAYLPSEKFKLKDYVIKDKKVYLPEAMVPYNSKLREPKKVSSKEEAIKTIKSNAGKYMDMFTGFDGKGKPIGIHEHEIEVLADGSAIIPGEFFLYTRIPSDAMHSTTLARVKGRLPKQMGNVIITNFASQQMAGSDFDGDQRHIEGFFKNTTKKVVKGKEQKLVRVDINEETKHGIANKAFHMEAQAFYNVANHKSFTNPINTSHYDSILENLPKDKMKRQDSGTAFVDARTKNNVGLACVGINANMQSVGDYIKAHDSFVKIQKERKSDKQFSPLRLPIITIKDGVFTLKDSKVIASFTQDEKVKDALGDFQNLSLDNVKDPKIERLGLNEVSAKMFNTAMVMKPDDVDVDVWAESVIGFFNLPTVKEYVNRVRETKRINSDIAAEDVFGIMAEELNGDKYINTERDVNLSKEDLTSTKSMNVLRKLKVLNDLTFDLDKIHSIIRLTEKAPKSWAELEVAKQNLEAIEGNLLKYVDTSEFISRPFIQSAKDALKAADAYFDKFANETTNEAVRLKEEFELEWKENNDPDKPLFKQMKRKQMEAFSSAVKSMMLTNSRKRDTKYEQWASTFVDTVKKMKESGKKNPIVDALQYNNNKLELREDLKRSDITEYEKQQIDKEFERLESSTLEEDKQFLKDLVDYNIFTTGLSASAPSGSYAVLFPMYVHKEIGLAMKEEKARWDAGFTDEQFDAIYNEMFDENIILQSPKAEKNLKGKTIYEPFFRKNAEIVKPSAPLPVIKVAGTKVINNDDIDSFKQYLSKSNGTKPKEFFTAKTKFKEFFNPETGKKEKAPQSAKWILNNDGYYDLVDKEGGEIYITDVDLTTGYQMIVAINKEIKPNEVNLSQEQQDFAKKNSIEQNFFDGKAYHKGKDGNGKDIWGNYKIKNGIKSSIEGALKGFRTQTTRSVSQIEQLKSIARNQGITNGVAGTIVWMEDKGDKSPTKGQGGWFKITSEPYTPNKIDFNNFENWESNVWEDRSSEFKIGTKDEWKSIRFEAVNQPTEIKPNEVEITKSNYTRQEVKNNPNTAYVFTENTHSITAFPDRSGGGSAIIRPEPNAFAIVTKKKYDYNTRENVDYTNTDANFKEFTEVNTKLINELKNSGKSKVVFPQGFATDKAKMPTRFAEWLQKELLNNFGLVTELNSTKTGLISKSVNQSTEIKPKKEESKEKEKKEMKNPSDFKGYSGAAIGSDKLWSLIGKKFGIGKQVDYTPNDLQKLTEEQRKEVESAYLKAVKDLGRGVMKYNWANPQKEDYGGGLTRRDYLQAKAGDAVFAISDIILPNEKGKEVKGIRYSNKLDKPIVDGGTGYAVQMGINLNKLIYVFHQGTNKDNKTEIGWYKWENNSFLKVNTPILTKKFAGIGTREINDAGKQAIQDVYENTFGTQEIEIPKRTDELSKIDAKNFEILVRILSDVNNLNQRQKDALKDVNLKTLKPTAGNFGLLQKIKCL